MCVCVCVCVYKYVYNTFYCSLRPSSVSLYINVVILSLTGILCVQLRLLCGTEGISRESPEEHYLRRRTSHNV